MQKEIEIKARLNDKEAVMQKLRDLGCVFEDPITQEDVVYAENVSSLKDFRVNNTIFLRIRIKNGKKIIFTVKKRMANDLDALEAEVEVSNSKSMEDTILLMGYKEAVRVSKTRIITHYNGCEICIDDVANLGAFIEMEKLADEGDSSLIQEELFVFFESLGIKREDRAFVGYDVLILEKKGV